MNTPIHDEHAKVWPMLPWHANGSLDYADEAAVADHVRHCATCRAELAWQRRLHAAAAIEPDPPLPDMDAALARLLPRLEEPAVPASRTATSPAPRPAILSMLADWLRRAPRAPLLPAAFALLLVALTVSLPPGRDEGYRGLGPVAEAGADTAVVFHPGTPEAEVRRILSAAGAASVEGPTDAGAYVLSIGPAHQAEALARLRADPAVLMAEPLAAPEAH